MSDGATGQLADSAVIPYTKRCHRSGSGPVQLEHGRRTGGVDDHVGTVGAVRTQPVHRGHEIGSVQQHDLVRSAGQRQLELRPGGCGHGQLGRAGVAMSWVSSRPVGPAPNSSTVDPGGRAKTSMPCTNARRRLGKDGNLEVQVVDVEATIGVCDHELGEAAGRFTP